MATYYKLEWVQRDKDGKPHPCERRVGRYEYALLGSASMLHEAVTGTADHGYQACMLAVAFLRARLKDWHQNSIHRVSFTEEYIRMLCREVVLVWLKHYKIDENDFHGSKKEEV